MYPMWIDHVDEAAQLASAAEALTRQARAATDPATRHRLRSLARAHREMLSPAAWSPADELPADRALVEAPVDDFKAAA
jgi:hypothetical protein